MMLMHWGAFTLANHGWTEPIERALKAAKKNDVNLITPKIGETVPLVESISTPVTYHGGRCKLAINKTRSSWSKAAAPCFIHAFTL